MFVALGFKHAMRMPHIVFLDISDCAIFFTLLQKRQAIRKKCEILIGVSIFSSKLVWNMSIQESWVRYDKNIYWSSYKVTAIIVTFERKGVLKTDFRKNIHKPNFM